MMYQQIITIYATIVVEAGSKEEAQDKIKKILHKSIKVEDGEILIGDFEREDEVKEVK